jgi:hypothetical protein
MIYIDYKIIISWSLSIQIRVLSYIIGEYQLFMILDGFFKKLKFEFQLENSILISRFYFSKIDGNIRFFMKIKVY